MLFEAIQKGYTRLLWISSLCTPPPTLSCRLLSNPRVLGTNIWCTAQDGKIVSSLSWANIKEHPLHIRDIQHSPSQALEMLWKYSEVKDTSPRQSKSWEDKMLISIKQSKYKGVTSTVRTMGSETGEATRVGAAGAGPTEQQEGLQQDFNRLTGEEKVKSES